MCCLSHVSKPALGRSSEFKAQLKAFSLLCDLEVTHSTLRGYANLRGLCVLQKPTCAGNLEYQLTINILGLYVEHRPAEVYDIILYKYIACMQS